MREDAPKAGDDWFKIVNKKGEPAKVYIYDEIGYWGTSAKEFAAQFDDIEGKEIHLHINSPGGSVFDGLAISAAIKDHKATVTGKVDGMAASAASFILQACNSREIGRNAQVMIHDATAYAGGNALQMRKAADLLDRVSDNIADIYAVRSGQLDKAGWRKIMVKGDTWYDGNEALAVGLVDTVIDNPEEEDEEVPDNSWTKEEIDAFLIMPAAQLAKDAQRSVITNRVEEAPNMGDMPSTKTPPAVPQPPAQPEAVAPVAPVKPEVATSPEAVLAPSTPLTLVMNGATVTDISAIQNHINGLETFKKETIEGGRKSFVNSLAEGPSPKIAATQITDMEEFALSLSNEQFAKWKASMEAAPSATLLGKHGATPGDKSAPENGVESEIGAEIATLEGIVQSHRDSGSSQEQIEAKESWKKLQALIAQQSSAS